MRDSKLAIRTAYFTALNGNITLAGFDVPVWDRVPTRQSYPYVKLSTQTSVFLGGKQTCVRQDTTILLDIVTSYDGEQGGKQDADLIADQCLILLTDTLPILIGDLKLVMTQVDSDFDIEESSASGYIIRRLIRFRNTIQQLV